MKANQALKPILIAKYVDGSTTVSMETTDYNRLKNTRLKGCPFEDYNAYDLLRDLLYMYSWKIKAGIYYTVGEYLTICNDIKAEMYRNIYTED